VRAAGNGASSGPGVENCRRNARRATFRRRREAKNVSQKSATPREQGAFAEVPHLRFATSGYARERL